MSKNAIELNSNIKIAFVKQFPQFLDKTFDILTEQEKQQIKDFFQQALIDGFTEIKSLDNTYSLTNFYRELALIYHPDKMKFNKFNKELLGNIPFQALSEVFQNLIITSQFSSISINLNQLDPYDFNWPITNQLLQFNEKQIKELNSYALGRFFITLRAILLKFPFGVIQGLLAIPLVLNGLLRLFIFKSGVFNFNDLTAEYIQIGVEQRTKKYMPNMPHTFNFDSLEVNHFINICLEIKTLHLAESASLPLQNSVKAFEIFERFIKMYSIPGILPKNKWTFDYVYPISFKYLAIINHFKLYYPNPASTHLKGYLECLLEKHRHTKDEKFDSLYPQFNITDIYNFLTLGSPEDKKFLETLKKKNEEDILKIEIEAILFGKFEDRLYAYASKWKEFKETYTKMSDTDKKQAISEGLGLGLLVFINESVSAIHYLINNVLEISVQVLSAILLTLISLPIKLVELCQKIFEPQSQQSYQLVCIPY